MSDFANWFAEIRGEVEKQRIQKIMDFHLAERPPTIRSWLRFIDMPEREPTIRLCNVCRHEQGKFGSTILLCRKCEESFCYSCAGVGYPDHRLTLISAALKQWRRYTVASQKQSDPIKFYASQKQSLYELNTKRKILDSEAGESVFEEDDGWGVSTGNRKRGKKNNRVEEPDRSTCPCQRKVKG